MKEVKSATQRWEDGDEHDPRSQMIAGRLREIDWAHCDGAMDLRFGGDGDNGESLLYALDIMFELGYSMEAE